MHTKHWFAFDAFLLFGTKWITITWLSTRRRHKKQTCELHPNASNSHVDIIGIEINRHTCTQPFTIRTLNICRKPTHQQKTNQCHLLVLFIIIDLTRSPTLECLLYISCSSKDQNNEANRKRWERRPMNRIYHLCRGAQETRMPMPPRSIRKAHRLASKRMPEPPQHIGDPPLCSISSVAFNCRLRRARVHQREGEWEERRGMGDGGLVVTVSCW
jgi:hypothetical protein